MTSSNIQVNLRLFTSGDHFKNNRSFTMLSCHHKRENRLWAVTWEKTCCSNHVFVYSFLSSLLAFILSSSICSHTSHIQIILNKHMPLKATFFLNVVLPFPLSLMLAWHLFYYHLKLPDLLCVKVFISLLSFLSHNPSPKTLLVWFIPWFYCCNNHIQHEHKKYTWIMCRHVHNFLSYVKLGKLSSEPT